MKTFDQLTHAQRRGLAFLATLDDTFYEELKTGELTRASIVNAWRCYEALEEKPEKKIGVPNWLYSKEFKDHRGHFVIPAPTEDELFEALEYKPRVIVNRGSTKGTPKSPATTVAEENKREHIDPVQLSTEETNDYEAELAAFGI